MAAKAPKPANAVKGKKPQSKFDPREKKSEEMQALNAESSAIKEAEICRSQLAEDRKNPSLDVGPNDRPLFTSCHSLSLLTKDDASTCFEFSMDELKDVFPEGLPLGMAKEFEESSMSALLVRQCFIDLRDNFQKAVNLSLVINSKAPKVRKQIVLDGSLSCGKSTALAMLVYWARKEGWLVLYVPRGREWTRGDLFYKNPQTDLWDTPVQAANVLRIFCETRFCGMVETRSMSRSVDNPNSEQDDWRHENEQLRARMEMFEARAKHMEERTVRAEEQSRLAEEQSRLAEEQFRRSEERWLVFQARLGERRRENPQDEGSDNGSMRELLGSGRNREPWRKLEIPVFSGSDAYGWTQKDILKFNKSCLQGLKCNILDPILLGGGAGVEWPKDSDKLEISERTTLYQLIEAGLNNTHAAVGVVVRLRQELAKVTSVPVLFAIDQYNSWFTFTEYEEPVTVRSCRPIHARELATVNAFRSMMHEDMMVGAFSHSTAVGKLRQVYLMFRLMLESFSLGTVWMKLILSAITISGLLLSTRKRQGF
ncbi:hypothetical protein OROGR_024784 [Orobanche gracilis]